VKHQVALVHIEVQALNQLPRMALKLFELRRSLRLMSLSLVPARQPACGRALACGRASARHSDVGQAKVPGSEARLTGTDAGA
jgi:hypothetical protein